MPAWGGPSLNPSFLPVLPLSVDSFMHSLHSDIAPFTLLMPSGPPITGASPPSPIYTLLMTPLSPLSVPSHSYCASSIRGAQTSYSICRQHLGSTLSCCSATCVPTSCFTNSTTVVCCSLSLSAPQVPHSCLVGLFPHLICC